MDKEREIEEEKRAKIAKRAPLLTKVFVEGKDYREPDIVKLKDGSYFKILLKPVGDEDIFRAFDEVGIEEIPTPSTPTNISQIKFARLAARLALIAIDTSNTGLTEEQIVENLAYGEATRIGSKILARLFTMEAIESDRSPDMGAEAGLFRTRDQ